MCGHGSAVAIARSSFETTGGRRRVDARTSTRATTRQSDARSKRRGDATRRDAISREARFGRRSSARDDDTDGNRVASDASRRDLSIRPRGAGARGRARRSTGATARGKREIKGGSRSLAVRRALGRR